MWVISNNLVLLEIFQINYFKVKIINLLYILHFLGGSDGEESACNALYININNVVFMRNNSIFQNQSKTHGNNYL